ncbi:MAG: SurA N-terminal domain-containing protein [Candidatus Omnitrophica bacterium]|nr:SurA N-terminal domain-containing protein [Candidatus Omnitrophota bacterium]
MKKYTVIFLVCFLLKTIYGLEIKEDRSIAMVGNRVIWDNDIKERAQVRGISYETAVMQIIEESLLVIQAKKEGIPATKEEIDNRFNFIVSEWEKKGIDFYGFIRENGLTVDQYKEIIAQDIQKEKLISQKIHSRIKVSPFEISKKMSEMPQEKQVLLYKKSFDDCGLAESFIAAIKTDRTYLEKMDSTDWVSISKIDSALISELYAAGKGNPVIKKLPEKTVVYILAEEKSNSPEERYKMAYQKIKLEKFIKEYSEYLDSLARKIPIKVFDASIAKKLSVPISQQ